MQKPDQVGGNFKEDILGNHGSLIENRGTLNINTLPESSRITLDGSTGQVVNYSLIDVRQGNLNINNMLITGNNKNGGHGGGLIVTKSAIDSTIQIKNVVFQYNKGNYGGAIFINSPTCNTSLENVVVSNNEAKIGSGGGIYAYGNLNISGKDTLISSNKAKTSGGGIMVKSNCILNDGKISSNEAENSGGGIAVDGTLTYNGGIITENSAKKMGGGIYYKSVTGGILKGKAFNGNVHSNHAENDGDPSYPKNPENYNEDLHPDPKYNIDWTTDENLKLRKINVNLFKSYKRSEDIIQNMSSQGMTTTNDYLVFTLYKSDKDATKIAIANKDDGTIIDIIDTYEGTNCFDDKKLYFEHANDMTWDPVENKFYILTSGKKIYKFGISVSNGSAKMTNLEVLNSPRQYSAIAYDKDNKHFIGKNRKTMYIIDKDFNKELSSFNFSSDLTSQGMGYYNGNIYFCCTETGQTSSTQPEHFNNKEKLSNVIYKYALDGTLVQTFYIPNTTLYGEIESCAFDENGTLFASYNISLREENGENHSILDESYNIIHGGEKTNSFYCSNIDVQAPVLEINYSTTETTNKDVIVTITANEEIQKAEGWNLSDDKKSLTKIYMENKVEDIEVYDTWGNKSTIGVNISNIDKEPLKLDIKYSTTKITNQDVVVTINSNKELRNISDWILSEDKKILTKTYSENDSANIDITDLAGNVSTASIDIKNIDKEKPVLDINYSTTMATNKDVVVTIKSNEEIKDISGWGLSENKKILTKTYSENDTTSIEIMDIAGNVSTAPIDIKNIDKEKPIVQVKYSSKDQTLNDVVVIIEANEEIQEVEGWQISDDKRSISKTYTKNDMETIEIYDLAGNNISETIKVDNIDKEKPEYELKYSTTLSTNEDVCVTIESNEEIQGIKGWNLSKDKKVLTKIYTKNTKEEITIKDIAGNSASKTIIKINNIDKIKPEIKIDYSITKITNQDIIVNITANEEIKEIDGWNLSNKKNVLTKKFSANAEENITISDLAGNKISDTIKISNIDKTAPKIDITYSETEKEVVVTIISDKNIKILDGWSLSSDMKQLTKTFKENGEHEIEITDEAGNSVTTKIKVSKMNVSKNEKNLTNKAEYYENLNEDTTIAKTTLPKAGEKSTLKFMILCALVCVILYVKLKKYKDIK